MKTHRLVCSLLIVAALGVFAFVSVAQKPSESQTLINAARFLEEKPLDKKAKDIRKGALTWIIQTDKVTVKACTLILNGPDEKYKYGGELFGQYMIGIAAFKLANPDQAGDEDAAQLAGVESSLLAYEAMLKTEQKAQNAFMDDLVAKRSNNTLAEFVKGNNCKDKK